MWNRCSTIARFHLRLSAVEFFELTPRQFHTLLDEHRQHIEHEELLVGILASAIVNSSFAAPQPPARPADFMPSQLVKKPRRAKRINREAVARNLRSVFEAHNRSLEHAS